MLIGQNIIEIEDFLEERETERELKEISDLILQSLLPNILLQLVLNNKIDKAKIYDRNYLFSKVKDFSREIGGDNIFYIVESHKEFIDAANDAIKTNKNRIAIILIATAIENILNVEYSFLLRLRNFSNNDIYDIIRGNQIPAKIGWLMKLVFEIELEERFKKKILKITEIRNAIIHYKARPFTLSDEEDINSCSSDDIEGKIKRIDFDILSIPEELDKKLRAQKYILYPDLNLVIEMMNSIYDGKHNFTPDYDS
jgi:hypothetical protein